MKEIKISRETLEEILHDINTPEGIGSVGEVASGFYTDNESGAEIIVTTDVDEYYDLKNFTIEVQDVDGNECWLDAEQGRELDRALYVALYNDCEVAMKEASYVASR